MSYTWSTFTITTATYTVVNTFSYDAYYVDTSVSNTSIVVTLPTTVGNGGQQVQFISVTSVQGGDTTSNTVTIQTAVAATQSIFQTGISQAVVPKNGYLQLRVQDNGASGLWVTPAQNQFQNGVYGDGSDGTVTATTSTLAADMYYQNLIVPTGVTLSTGNFRIFVNGLLTMQGTGRIANVGANGGNGASGAGGTAGPAGTTQFYTAGGAGGAGATNNANGTAAPSVGNAVGGVGGTGGATTLPATARAATTGGNTLVPAASGSTKVIKQPVNAVSGLLPTAGRFVAGGGGGGGNGGAVTSGGGGGGAGGGIILLAARQIIVTGTGSTISANGGTGGNGGGTVGSGGGGGGGGAVIVITQTPNLTTNFTGQITITANGGAGGTGSGTGSTAGGTGNAGIVNFLSS